MVPFDDEYPIQDDDLPSNNETSLTIPVRKKKGRCQDGKF